MIHDCVCGHPYYLHIMRITGECLAPDACHCMEYDADDDHVRPGNCVSPRPGSNNYTGIYHRPAGWRLDEETA